MRLAARPLALVVAVALAAACSSSPSTSSSTGAAPAAGLAKPGADSAAGAPGPGGAAGTTAGAGSSLTQVPVQSGAVVRTAQLTVESPDVRAAAVRAGQLARDAGGSLASERADGSGATASAELVLRVPPDRFDPLLDQLGRLGQERSRTVSTEQVGDQLVDLQSRLQTQRASVERVRALLAGAKDLAQVVQIEQELTRRTADLESLQARLAALQGRVDLSTVTLRLTATPPSVTAATPGFLDGLRGGWAGLLAAGRIGGLISGALLPFLPVAAVAALVARWARRRRAVPGDAGAV